MRAEAESHGADPLPHQHRAPRRPHLRQLLLQGRGPVVNHQGLYDNFMVVTPGARPVRLRRSRRSRPTTPTAAPLFPDRDEYYQDPNKGTIVFTGDLTLRVGDHTFHLPPHAGPHARAARGPRAGGARRLHRRHDLQRVPDVADDLERRPVARGARADPRPRRRPPRAGPRAGPDRSRTSTRSAPSCSSGRRPSPTRWPRAGRARRPSPGSASTTASARSTSGRAT